MFVNNTLNGFVFGPTLRFDPQPRGLFQRRMFHLSFLDSIFDCPKTLRRCVLFTTVNLHHWNLILIAQISPLLPTKPGFCKAPIVLAFTDNR